MKQSMTGKALLPFVVLLATGGVIAGLGSRTKLNLPHPLLSGFKPATDYRKMAGDIKNKRIEKIVFDGTELSWKVPGDTEITDETEIRSIIEALCVASLPEGAEEVKNRGRSFFVKTTTGYSYFNFAGLKPAYGFGPEFTEAINQIGRNRTRDFKKIVSNLKVDHIKLYDSLEIKSGKQLDEVMTAFQSAENLFDYVNNTEGSEVVFYPTSGKPVTFWIRIPREKITFPYKQKRDPEMISPPLPQPLWRLLCKAERKYAADFEKNEHPYHGEN